MCWALLFWSLNGNDYLDRPCELHLQEYDLLSLLRQDRDIEEEYIQSSEISDADLLRALDRTDLYSGMRDHEPNPGFDFPIKGPGWEVVLKADSSRNFLTSIESYRKFNSDKKMV